MVGKEAESLRAFVSLNVYCGAYYGPPWGPDGEQGECGWTTTAAFDAEEWSLGFAPHIVCGRCGCDLGRDDMGPVSE